MSNKIGRFEIISQAAKSSFATVYKALDSESQQTIALKVVALTQVLDRDSLVKSVFEEADRSKPLNSPNIAQLYGVGDEDGQLLAGAEYIQGNSIATTLARKDGFSIWDMQDVARQVCHALDHAQVHKVVHYSLEPAKIMVQWDGMVKVLGFGISWMNGLAGTSSDVPEILHYVSPEQLRGEVCDHRSAIFALGAILYEMATERKAFAGETADQVRAAILESTPPLPQHLKQKLSPALGTLIMKALAKSPAERYQSGQELVRDLEQANAATTKTTTVPTPKTKAQAAAAAVSGVKPPTAASAAKPPAAAANSPFSKTAPAPAASAAAAAEPAAKPNFAVDPMMADNDDGTPAAAARKSFSDLEELPPLKEIFVPSISPSPAVPPEEELAQVQSAAKTINKKAAEKPKVQVREAAQKAVTEIRNTPKQLYIYAFGGAALLIAAIIAGLMIYNFFQDHDFSSSGSASVQQSLAKHKSIKQTAPPAPAPAAVQAQAQAPVQPPEAQPPAAIEPEPAPVVTEAPPKAPRVSRGRSRKQAAVGPQLAELTVASIPAGAQISFDGSPLCQSPCTLTDIAPGQHVVAASKSGYSSESRTISLRAGASSSFSIQLGAVGTTLSVASTPAGAVVLLDGKDTGKLTPTQLAVSKPGVHTVVIRRNGYLESSNSVNVEAGQSANVNVTLTKLGDTEDIRAAGGKFKKLFGHGGDSASMGIVSIKTQPKGAQIMVNNRVLDKTAPFDFYLNPGTYVIDISMSGYRGLHRVVNVEEGEKVAIEETLLPQ
jgi:eukaryotic-like serine/threonine-protein kinase